MFVAVVGAGLIAWAGYIPVAVAAFVAFVVTQTVTSARRPLTSTSYGVRSKWKGGGGFREALTFRPDEVKTRFGTRIAKVPSRTQGSTTSIRARGPVREQCAHYKRQLFANDDQPDPNSAGHRIVFRNCTMRRSVGGAFMSIRDEAVYACDYRSPPSAASSRMLDELDEKILENSRTRQLVPLFNLTAKLPAKKKETT